jgi:hypothetical protein
MTLTLVGLILDMIGVVLIGLVAPRHVAYTVPVGAPGQQTGPRPWAVNWKGRVVPRVGWGLLVLGIGLQIIDQLAASPVIH